MRIVYKTSGGLDVHKKNVVACRMKMGAHGKKVRETHTFGTTTAALLELSDWLGEWSIEHVALESTGEYWKPIYNVLEEQFKLVLVNAHHVKHVPGRKTDVKDAEWLAELQMYGLLKASFVPPPGQRVLRVLTRNRTKLVQERARIINRLQKILEEANLKLASVVSDVMGRSGRLILEALVAGEQDPVELAQLAHGSLRDKKAALVEALTGNVQPHHLFLLKQHLEHFDFLTQQIDAVSQRIAEQIVELDDQEPPPPSADNSDDAGLEPLTYTAALNCLETIPGVSRRIAEVIVAELGVDMARFPSAKQAAAWSGVTPGIEESAGKRKSTKAKPGNQPLKTTLTQAAWAASHTKDTYLAAQYRRLAPRRGRKRAIVAVAHSILVSAYFMLKHHVPYQELGSDYFDQRKQSAVVSRLVRRIKKLGFDVELTAIATAPTT